MSKKRRRRASQTRLEPPSLDSTVPQVKDRRITGAISSYRGYRLQALYALSRLLSSPSHVMHPECIEDLSILADGRLLEAVQVKALESPLALSDLDPGSPGSFFKSAAARSAIGSTETLTIATFGPLGKELSAFASGDEGTRLSVQSKLVGFGIAADAVDRILPRLRFEVVDEATLRRQLTTQLRETVGGIDPEVAFDLLTLWLYLRSEERAQLSAADVRDRLLAIGEFLADRVAHHAEWFTSIVPIADPETSPPDPGELAEEFYRGVAVRYEHVVAGLAVDRPTRIAEIEESFAAERIVIVHSASGQGKTTLAYQFMRHLPDAWRFSVRVVENRSHALAVARAIAGHARAMDLPLVVHLDVGPRDTDWPTLARELAASPQIRVLVTIREEDWRRSTETWTFPSRDVDPTFSQDEAAAIYEGLRARFADAPPTFAEAWSRFGRAGPLLEFVHLVTQRQDLPGRLHDQIEGIRSTFADEAPAVIAFLRYVSVATESGTRAHVRPLADLARLRDPGYVLNRLEREYLIRLSEDRAVAGGLHPVRSRLVADLLTDPDLQSRSRVIVEALPAITEEDLEAVLLHALDVGPDARDEVLAGVYRLRPRTWTGIANVGRALRWRGIADYAENHRELIEDADPGRTGSWSVMLRSDIAEAMPGSTEEIWETMLRIANPSAERRAAGEQLRGRQRPGREAFGLLRRWLDDVELPVERPMSTEWASVGEVLFFAQYLGAGAHLVSRVDPEWLDEAVANAPISDLAALSLGLGQLGSDWRSNQQQRLIEAYRVSTQGIRFSDDGAVVKVDFIHGVPPRRDVTISAIAEAGGGTREAVSRLELLRQLLPDRERYASQGCGHRMIDAVPDDTAKNIERRRLPPRWLTSANATFRGYVERWWRMPSWSSYTAKMLEDREFICERLERVTAALIRYHRRRTGGISPTDLSGDDLMEFSNRLSVQHLLPTPAVDPWGFVDEGGIQAGRSNDKDGGTYGLALVAYDGYYRSHRDLVRSLTNFAQQAPTAMAISAALGRAPADDREAARVRIENAGATWRPAACR